MVFEFDNSTPNTPSARRAQTKGLIRWSCLTPGHHRFTNQTCEGNNVDPLVYSANVLTTITGPSIHIDRRLPRAYRA
jgi:hypothetical protein